MTKGMLVSLDRARPWARLRVAGPALALACLAWFLLFRAEIAAAVAVWDSSTAYGHCFFVIPIALYLAWDRREAIVGTPLIPLPLAALLAAPLALAWLVAERVGLMEGRQLVAVALFEVLCLAVLGWRMARVLAAPLLYLFFLVPFGAFLTPLLQDFTARFIDVGLDVLGIAHFSDHNYIEISAGTFLVAEACAGLRFLIAAIAFGVLYACMIYRGPVRRAVFIAVSIVVPIVANGLRGLGIVVLGDVLGSAQAAAADHIIYGWLFFSVVILLLIAAGLPFRQDNAPYPPLPGPAGHGAGEARFRATALAALAAIALSATGPATAALLDRAAGAAPVAIDPDLAVPLGCTMRNPAATTPGASVAHRVVCGETTLAVTVTTLAPRANPADILRAVRAATGELDAEDASVSVLRLTRGDPARWRLVETSSPARLTATALWVEGAPSPLGLAFRLAQAWRGVAGASHAVVVVAVSADGGAGPLAPARRRAILDAIGGLLAAQKDLGGEISRLSGIQSPR